ncbi:MAG: glycosyltransferase family 39 protein [Rhodobacteraceae bacterium]|nr:glycosyltransferase family 39 protein [Paracoccaceae bacterium]
MPRSKRLWLLVLGFAALHLVLAGLLPLAEDEAYYQLWATAPSAGYYDHPPMVAWAIATGQMLLGTGPLGVRLASVLAGALVTLLTWRIAWLFSRDDDVAFRAALWGKVMLPVAAFGFAATPDAFSVLFWTAATWGMAEALVGRRNAMWLAAGLFAGLGVLAKFTNLFFGVGAVLWLLATRKGRASLKRWQVWAGALAGLAVLVPFALWNRAEGWIGLERQFGRIGAEPVFSAADMAMFWLSLILYVTPLLVWLALKALASGRVPPLLIWLTAPAFLYLASHATRAAAGGQWLLPIFPTLAVMAALASGRGFAARWAAPSALALAGLIMAVGFWPGRVLIPGHNPFTQGRGWPDVVAEIRTRADQAGATWIATDAYGLTGQLHHYLGDDIPVWSLIQPERYLFRGPFPADLCAAPGLFISRSDFPAGVPYATGSIAGPDILRREGDVVLMRYFTAIITGPNRASATGCPQPADG